MARVCVHLEFMLSIISSWLMTSCAELSIVLGVLQNKSLALGLRRHRAAIPPKIIRLPVGKDVF